MDTSRAAHGKAIRRPMVSWSADKDQPFAHGKPIDCRQRACGQCMDSLRARHKSPCTAHVRPIDSSRAPCGQPTGRMKATHWQPKDSPCTECGRRTHRSRAGGALLTGTACGYPTGIARTVGARPITFHGHPIDCPRVAYTQLAGSSSAACSQPTEHPWTAK